MNQDTSNSIDPKLVHIIPHTNMRKTVAKRLSESKRTIPHFYVTMQCNVTKLVQLRSERALNGGVKASINDFVIHATARALKRVSAMNAWWGDDAITRHTNVNLCIAIGTERGLFTPVLRRADEMTVEQLAVLTSEMIDKAKRSGFKTEDYQGGTFTVSNLGMYGVKEFAAIINPPQVGILAIGAIEKSTSATSNSIQPLHMMNLTVSADHRAVDGVTVAQFLKEIKAFLENPND